MTWPYFEKFILYNCWACTIKYKQLISYGTIFILHTGSLEPLCIIWMDKSTCMDIQNVSNKTKFSLIYFGYVIGSNLQLETSTKNIKVKVKLKRLNLLILKYYNIWNLIVKIS